MQESVQISIVVPVYGCKDLLSELYLRLSKVLVGITENYEIILVNDCSIDDPWQVISDFCQRDKRVKGINLSRNFGQHFAITAGLENCCGNWVVVMDCDLQDSPEEVANLYYKAIEGYDIVFAQRVMRSDGIIKKLFSKLFYKVLAYFTDTNQDHTIGNFGIYSNQAIQSVLSMHDRFRFFPTMIKWVGFKSTTIPVVHNERSMGKSSYSPKKLINLGLNTILTFSDKPLRLTVKLGLLLVLFSILYSIFNIYLYFTGQIVGLGWTSLIISIWFLSGTIIFILGIIGLYVGKTFDNVKNRPLYIIKDKINIGE